MNTQDACYSVNRKGGYVTIYNTQTRYPLELWNELRTQQDLTHQDLANAMLKLERENEA